MPDSHSLADRMRWWPELFRPLTRQEQEALAELVMAAAGRNRRSDLPGAQAAIGYHLAARRLIAPTKVDASYTVTAHPTAFGKLVACAHEAVNLCHAHPLDHEPESLFTITCPECNGTGAEKPDCWLCKGTGPITVQKAYRHRYKKADLENVEGDGYCDCPACGGDSCETCGGDGRVAADFLFRQARRVLLTAGREGNGAFPDIRWFGGTEGGVIDSDSLLSPAAHAWLYDLGFSWGRFGDMLSEWVSLSDEGEAAIADLLAPTAVADLVRMWRAGEPWRLPDRRYRDGLFRPEEREAFDEHAALHRSHARGWVAHDYRASGSVWTDEGREAVAGWDGAEILLDHPRLDRPASLLQAMEWVSRTRRAVAEAERMVVRCTDRVEAAQARLDAAEHRGDHREVELLRRRLDQELTGIMTGYRGNRDWLDRCRRDLAYALDHRCGEEGCPHHTSEARHG